MSAASRERTYQVNGLSLTATVIGPSHAKPLICLHGWLDNAASFAPLSKYQSSYLKDYQLICLEWAGHGHSEHKSNDSYYHFIDWVYDLLQFIEINGWETVDILGHSMGAMVASAFAATFPEKINRLIAIEAFGFITTPAQDTKAQIRRGLLSRLHAKSKTLKRHAQVSSAVAARQSVSDLDIHCTQLLVERGIEYFNDGFSWRSDPRLKLISPIRLCPEQAENLLQGISMPMLVILGTSGFDYLKSNLEQYSYLVPHLLQASVEGGHHLHMQAPEQTAKIIADFLKN